MNYPWHCAALAALFLALPGIATAQDPVGLVPTDEDAADVRSPGYSPYAGRNFPTRVYWGDTHVHTNNWLDARGFGVIIGPEEAFRFARGEEVMSSHGEPFKLRRPLDWLVVCRSLRSAWEMAELAQREPRRATLLSSTESIEAL